MKKSAGSIRPIFAGELLNSSGLGTSGRRSSRKIETEFLAGRVTALQVLTFHFLPNSEGHRPADKPTPSEWAYITGTL